METLLSGLVNAELASVIRVQCSSKLYQPLAESLLSAVSSLSSTPLTLWAAIRPLEEKLDPMQVGRLALALMRHCPDSLVLQEEFLSNLATRMEYTHKGVVAGSVLCRLQAMSIHLNDADDAELRKRLKGIKEHLSCMLAKHMYYSIKASLHHKRREFAKFIKHALLMISHANLQDLANKEAIARDVCVAAVVDECTFSFGELLANPILAHLHQNDLWLKKWMLAFAHGDIRLFKQVASEFSDRIIAIPLLRDKKVFIEKKIQLTAVLELVFRQEMSNRVISFAAVASAVDCLVENVEFVLLKAFALGLIRGSIDQVKRTAYIHWVAPRVLDTNQIASLRDQIVNWRNTLERTRQNVTLDEKELREMGRKRNEPESVISSILQFQKSLETINI